MLQSMVWESAACHLAKSMPRNSVLAMYIRVGCAII
jgi:hypothetical protein